MHENEIGSIIVDSAVELHRNLGPGLLETVYEVTLARALERRGLAVRRQVGVDIKYEGEVFSEGFRADLIVEELVIVELKSVSTLLPEHRSQVLNYLNAGRYELGMLVNFGAHPRLQHERIALTRKKAVESGDFSLREE